VTGLLIEEVSSTSALVAFLIAALLVAGVTTPLAIRLSHLLGVVDRPGGRRIHDRPMPRLGGIGIMLGILVATLLTIPVMQTQYAAILIGAVLISALGAVDDGVGIAPPLKFVGQVACAVIPVAQGVSISTFTLPLIEPISLGPLQYPVTVIFIVAVANIVNFADGMDGLAAGLCAISAGTFAILALSLERPVPAALAAAVCGSCVGFLRWNFHPAKVFMGDSGSLPLGFLLASMSITGVMKTAAALALVFPMIVLLAPILDTSFVILKRLKHGQSIMTADANHLHHRLLRIGYSQRQAALLLYGWCAILSGSALAVRFLRYRTPDGHWHLGSTLVLVAIGAIAIGSSLYVVYALEIIKYGHLRRIGLARGGEEGDAVPVVVGRRQRRADAAGSSR
jgi:UDP-GlcNAc:undecaprenyl-phosphate GlcNAc-1-phosphate transferase